MKKIIYILLFILTDLFGIEVGVNTSYLHSVSHEYVYSGSYKLSELIWDTNSQILAGVKFSENITNTSKIVFNYKTLASTFYGVMDDYDWVYEGYEWSDWSHHENTSVDKYSNLNIYFENELYVTPDFDFYLILGYKYDYKAFSAYDGDYIYSYNSYRDTEGSFSGYVGGYKENFEATYLGLKLIATEGDIRVSISGNMPIVARAYSADRHDLRSFTNYNTYDTYTYVHLDVAVDYKIFDGLNVGLRYEYENNLEASGVTNRVYDSIADAQTDFGDNTTNSFYYNGSGISNEYNLVTLYLNHTFISD